MSDSVVAMSESEAVAAIGAAMAAQGMSRRLSPQHAMAVARVLSLDARTLHPKALDAAKRPDMALWKARALAAEATVAKIRRCL